GFACSTPFGITEVGIGVTCSCPVDGIVVLNAFRHHRGGHTRCATENFGTHSVLNAFRHHRGGHHQDDRGRSTARQVLNAFRHHRGGHEEYLWLHPVRLPSAQRLSASQRWA